MRSSSRHSRIGRACLPGSHERFGCACFKRLGLAHAVDQPRAAPRRSAQAHRVPAGPRRAGGAATQATMQVAPPWLDRRGGPSALLLFLELVHVFGIALVLTQFLGVRPAFAFLLRQLVGGLAGVALDGLATLRLFFGRAFRRLAVMPCALVIAFALNLLVGHGRASFAETWRPSRHACIMSNRRGLNLRASATHTLA